MKKLKRNILYVFGTLFVMTMCLFFSQPVINSRAAERQEKNGFINSEVTIDTSGTDIPAEVKSPVQKLLNLVAWLMISIGILAILVGGILLLFNYLTGGGHPGAGGVGFKIMVVGIVVLLIPVLINWLFPSIKLL